MKSQNSTFSRFRHGTYQIKGIDACCNMIANIFACRTPCNPGGWGQNSIYQNMVILQVKLRWNDECRQHSCRYFALRPPPRPWVGVKRSKIHIFQDKDMLHIKLKERTHTATLKLIFLHTDSTPLPTAPFRALSCLISN